MPRGRNLADGHLSGLKVYGDGPSEANQRSSRNSLKTIEQACILVKQFFSSPCGASIEVRGHQFENRGIIASGASDWPVTAKNEAIFTKATHCQVENGAIGCKICGGRLILESSVKRGNFAVNVGIACNFTKLADPL